MKNILIIGASSGIGLATVEILANEHQVWATYNKHETLSAKDHVHYQHLDVLQEHMDLSFLPEQIDALVYCPGTILLKPFARITEGEWLNDYRVNVLGASKVIQQVLPRLKKSNSASIVLFSTVAAQTGMPFHSVVAASKGAVEGLTRALAAEFAPSIRVNCIAPSLTETPLAGSLLQSEEKKQAAAQRHPLKRVGTVQDMAQAVEFFISEKSSWITGQVLHIDGGMGNLK
jgi:NAD(P)-dependent dehydrogenase (short-subunit alcohol dehydrogenase family)